MKYSYHTRYNSVERIATELQPNQRIISGTPGAVLIETATPFQGRICKPRGKMRKHKTLFTQYLSMADNEPINLTRNSK